MDGLPVVLHLLGDSHHRKEQKNSVAPPIPHKIGPSSEFFNSHSSYPQVAAAYEAMKRNILRRA